MTAHNNLAQTLSAQGDLTGARQHLEQALAASRRLLGKEHPQTSMAALNLFLALLDLNNRDTAFAVLDRDLRWLLDRDPATLGADQRKIRSYLAEITNNKW